MGDLNELTRNREALLLAELAAWLHDIGKLSCEFINKQSAFSTNTSWDHELVLRRSTRRIESKLGKSLSMANKDEFRSLVQSFINAKIPDHTKQRFFPNPNKITFINDLAIYLQHLNKKKEIEVSDVDIERIKDFFGKYPVEQQISEGFLPNDFINFVESNHFTILGQEATIADIIEQHGSPVEPRTELVKIFKPPGCDAIDSALDKGSLDECKEENKQRTDTFIATAFGFESKMISDIDQARHALATSKSLLNGTRNQRMNAIKSYFLSALGETRRPANDVTLWDHSYSVGVLYRTLLAKIILINNDFPPISSFLKNSKWTSDSWCLLKIRTAGIDYLFGISGIPDLLARKKMFENSLNRVQAFLEETLPLGIEVYRDENGSLFVVPSIPNLLDNICVDGRKLYEHILESYIQGTINKDTTLSIDGEVIPAIGPLSEAWNGIIKIPPMGKTLSDEDLISDSGSVNKAWVPIQIEIGESVYEFTEQICTVCGLRPQGYSDASSRLEHYHHKARNIECPSNCKTCKAISRGVCSICEQRRADRSKEWATKKLSTTIWIDEIADDNARLALVVGLFDLKFWLKGDLVKTMTVCNPSETEDKLNVILKNPSFARLRRIWETTRGFWQDVCPTDEIKVLMDSLVGRAVGLAGPRLEIRGMPRQKDGDETPGRYHAYDLVLLKGIKLSVAWDPEDGRSGDSKGRLISIDNLVYFASLADEKVPSKEKEESEGDYMSRLHRWAAETIRELLLQEKKRGPFSIEESTGYVGKANEWGVIDVEDVKIIQDSQYTPAIPIIAEPRTFMALVPADLALEVVSKIKAKYEREMGKVRNRLPLHLGIVYTHRRTPLRAILDAGRRMLDQKNLGDIDCWRVTNDVEEKIDLLPEKSKYLTEGSNQFNKWFTVCLESQEINRKLTWHVPAVMGDGTTPDNWYPYAFWIKDNDGNTEPAKAMIPRNCYFPTPNPWNKDKSRKIDWLMHAGELKEGDFIYFTPATLDFQWLDSAGQRFEISYDERGHRRNIPSRPYLLDDLETLEHNWKTLKDHLSKNQIYILRDLIEAKRGEWQVKSPRLSEDDPFWNFCRQALANADWKCKREGDQKGKPPWQTEGIDRKRWLDQWANHATLGWIADAVELHLQIMKEEV